MKLKPILLLVGLAGIASRIAYSLIGTTIDQNGVLSEPFLLLPLSYGLILIGFGGLILTFAKAKPK